MVVDNQQEHNVSILSILPGTGYGLSAPLVIAKLTVPTPLAQGLHSLHDALSKLISLADQTELVFSNDLQQDYVNFILYWVTTIQLHAGVPVFEIGKVLPLAASSSNVYIIALPYAPQRAKGAILAVQWVYSLAKDFCTQTDTDNATLAQSVKNITDKLFPYMLNGGNHVHILRAAHHKKIPWNLIAGSSYQFGWGAALRWLDSTFTDKTPTIGSYLAKEKIFGAQVLRRAGVPVPDHGLARSVEEALVIAKELGYPVVTKPSNLDGGVGVLADLQDADALSKAFLNTRQHCEHVLIEKHFVGEDYRLVVFHDKLVWAVHRQPGGVLGDGVHTIEQLLDVLNADPRRGNQARSPLTIITLDDEANTLLQEQHLSKDSIVPDGQFVRLRRTANVSTGGYPKPCLADVHPDNRCLAERAARALKLDIAGVDMLIPDISVSWRQSGAIICEVNSQPSLISATQKHLYVDLLSSVIFGSGRIPVVLIVGVDLADQVAQTLALVLKVQGMCVGVATSKGIFIDEQELLCTQYDVFSASNILINSEQVEAIIVVICDASIIQTGLAFDRYDLLILAESFAAHSSADMLSLAAIFVENNLGKIIVNVDDPAYVDMHKQFRGAQIITTSINSMARDNQHISVWLSQEGEEQHIKCGRADYVSNWMTLPTIDNVAPKNNVQTMLLSAAATILLEINEPLAIACLQTAYKAPDYYVEALAKCGDDTVRVSQVQEMLSHMDAHTRSKVLNNPEQLCNLINENILRKKIIEEIAKQNWSNRLDVRKKLIRLEEDILIDHYLRHTAHVPVSYPSDEQLSVIHAQGNMAHTKETLRTMLRQQAFEQNKNTYLTTLQAQTPVNLDIEKIVALTSLLQ